MAAKQSATAPHPSASPVRPCAVAGGALQKITGGALLMELLAMAIMGGTVLAWQVGGRGVGTPFASAASRMLTHPPPSL